MNIVHHILARWRWGRSLIGGRWLRRKEAGGIWIQWEASILKMYLEWPMDEHKFEMEIYP